MRQRSPPYIVSTSSRSAYGRRKLSERGTSPLDLALQVGANVLDLEPCVDRELLDGRRACTKRSCVQRSSSVRSENRDATLCAWRRDPALEQSEATTSKPAAASRFRWADLGSLLMAYAR